MPDLGFLLGALLLLALPGPTNALMAAAGATGARGFPLILAALAGYALAIIAITGIFGPWIALDPSVAQGLALAAALWLIWSAVRLWQSADADQPAGTISPRRVTLTTILNPKGLLLAGQLLTDATLANDAANLAGLAILILAIAALWLMIGRSIAHAGGARVTNARVMHASSIALVVFALILGGRAFAALEFGLS